MVEDASPHLRQVTPEVHSDLVEAMAIILDYQRVVLRLYAPDPPRRRAEALLSKYKVASIRNPYNNP